jgi:flagellar biosynthesis protein FlgN
MKRTIPVKQLLLDLGTDLNAYRKLAGMLDEQFDAALRLDGASLGRIGQAIDAEVSALDVRRSTRATVLGTTPGAAERLGQLLFPGAARAAQRVALSARFDELEQLIGHCKARATRNGGLLASQFEAMQRVLHGERHTYVPA